jgi:hypothetical protein
MLADNDIPRADGILGGSVLGAAAGMGRTAGFTVGAVSFVLRANFLR